MGISFKVQGAKNPRDTCTRYISLHFAMQYNFTLLNWFSFNYDYFALVLKSSKFLTFTNVDMLPLLSRDAYVSHVAYYHVVPPPLHPTQAG